MNLTDTQADLLHLGLDLLIAHPDHILESDLHRVVWVLAHMAARGAAESNDLAAMQIASDLAMQAQPPPEMITLTTAARLYGLNERTLRYHAALGHIEAEKRGKTWWLDHHDLVIWLESK